VLGLAALARESHRQARLDLFVGQREVTGGDAAARLGIEERLIL
jgi:hypothetical protein